MTADIDPTLEQQLIAWRHDFHQHPELANHEVRTSQKIREILTNWGIKILPTHLATGVFAEIGSDNPRKTLAYALTSSFADSRRNRPALCVCQ